MHHQSVIDSISSVIAGSDLAAGLFLSGSYANGMHDPFSDVDFVLVSEEGASDEVAALWKSAVEAVGEVVLWWDRTPVPVLINAITQDWTRIDVILLKPDQLARHTQATLKPVYDPQDLYAGLERHAPDQPPNLARYRWQAEEFIRILGLLHLAVGRAEYINGVLGVFHLRNLLVDLFIEETGAPHRGGVLHLNRLITQDQKDVLTALPPPVAEKNAMIDAHLAYAKAYLPTARARAARLGFEWPEVFENATWERLEASLGITRPY